jgi:hypothetical protein
MDLLECSLRIVYLSGLFKKVKNGGAERDFVPGLAHISAAKSV